MLDESTNPLSDKLIMVMDEVKTALNLSSSWNFQGNSTYEALTEDLEKSVTNIGKYN